MRGVLLEAVNELKQAEEIDEPTTAENREAMHVDQDRQGVAGSPGLADTIKRKIETAAVFVADITPVSRIPRRRDVKGSREKRNINPNVAIELGFALHALGEEHVLLILNEHYGGREFIPFDLQHLGGPIMYRLAPDASDKDVDAAKGRLKGQLTVALREYLKSPITDAAPQFRTVPSTTSRAVWFQPGSVLARLDENTEYGFVDDKGVYLRVAPRASLPAPISTAELYGLARQTQFGLLFRQQAGIPYYNENGAILLEGSPAGGPLRAASQAFHNGEIWGIGRSLLVENDHGRFIPAQLLETAFAEALPRFVDLLANRLQIPPPYNVEFGACGIKGYALVVDTNIDSPYVIHDEAFSDSFVLRDASSAALRSALLRIYEKFFRVAGHQRPANLFGFPS